MGADVVVQSLHKTLPSLTQTALLHIQGDLVSRERMQHALAVFQSSSPSYVLLASIEACVAELLERGEALLADWRGRLDAFYRDAGLEKLSLLEKERDKEQGFDRDPSKIVILCEDTDQSGLDLIDILRERHGIELEMALDGYAIAMTGLYTTDADLGRLGEALRAMDCDSKLERRVHTVRPYPLMPEAVMTVGDALWAVGRQVPFAESVGYVSRTYLWAYPPGIPLLLPGVRITEEIVEALTELVARGVELRSTFEGLQGFVEVVDKG